MESIRDSLAEELVQMTEQVQFYMFSLFCAFFFFLLSSFSFC